VSAPIALVVPEPASIALVVGSGTIALVIPAPATIALVVSD
jgi:hypothetical protein